MSDLATRLAKLAGPGPVADALVSNDPEQILDAGLPIPWTGAELVKIVKTLDVDLAARLVRRTTCPDALERLTRPSNRKAVMRAAVANPHMSADVRRDVHIRSRDKQDYTTMQACLAGTGDDTDQLLELIETAGGGYTTNASKLVARAIGRATEVDRRLINVVDKSRGNDDKLWAAIIDGLPLVDDDALRMLIELGIPSENVEQAVAYIAPKLLDIDDVELWRQAARCDELAAVLLHEIVAGRGPTGKNGEPLSVRELVPGHASARVAQQVVENQTIDGALMTAVLQLIGPDLLDSAVRYRDLAVTDDGLEILLGRVDDENSAVLRRFALSAPQRLRVAAVGAPDVLQWTADELEVVAARGDVDADMFAWLCKRTDFTFGPVARRRFLTEAHRPLDGPVAVDSLTETEHATIVARLASATEAINVRNTAAALTASPHAGADDIVAGAREDANSVLTALLEGRLAPEIDQTLVDRLRETFGEDFDRTVTATVGNRGHDPLPDWADLVFPKMQASSLTYFSELAIQWLHKQAREVYGERPDAWVMLSRMADDWTGTLEALIDTADTLTR